MWSRYTDGNRQFLLDKFAAAGITWIRMDVGWSAIEDTAKGARNAATIEKLERCLTMTASRGIKVLAMLWHTPGWANGNAGHTVPPTNPADYRDFAKWIAGRVKGRVAAWQVWNEPNNPTFFTGTAAGYTNVLKAGYTGFKAGDSAARVIFGGTSFNDAAWIRDAYAHGAKDSFDALATHPYQGFGDEPPEKPTDGNKWWFTNTAEVRKVMVEYGDADTQIWFTEWGWSTHANDQLPSSSSDYAWARGVSEATQADYAVRAINYARSNWSYVGPMFWYKDRSWDVATGEPEWLRVHLEGYGLLRADGSERPVYSALKRLLTGS